MKTPFLYNICESKYLANHRKNIWPSVGKIFGQVSEKYLANRRKNLEKLVFIAHNVSKIRGASNEKL